MIEIMKITSQLFALLPLAMAIGVAMAVQTALNTQLKEYLHSSLQAALLSFLVGTIALAILVFFQNSDNPTFSTLMHAISLSIYTAPKLGFLSLSGLIIFGQVATAMLLDHFGLLGTEKQPIHWQRLLGGIVIFIGVLLTLQR